MRPLLKALLQANHSHTAITFVGCGYSLHLWLMPPLFLRKQCSTFLYLQHIFMLFKHICAKRVTTTVRPPLYYMQPGNCTLPPPHSLSTVASQPVKINSLLFALSYLTNISSVACNKFFIAIIATLYRTQKRIFRV